MLAMVAWTLHSIDIVGYKNKNEENQILEVTIHDIV